MKRVPMVSVSSRLLAWVVVWTGLDCFLVGLGVGVGLLVWWGLCVLGVGLLWFLWLLVLLAFLCLCLLGGLFAFLLPLAFGLLWLLSVGLLSRFLSYLGRLFNHCWSLLFSFLSGLLLDLSFLLRRLLLDFLSLSLLVFVILSFTFLTLLLLLLVGNNLLFSLSLRHDCELLKGLLKLFFNFLFDGLLFAWLLWLLLRLGLGLFFLSFFCHLWLSSGSFVLFAGFLFLWGFLFLLLLFHLLVLWLGGGFALLALWGFLLVLLGLLLALLLLFILLRGSSLFGFNSRLLFKPESFLFLLLLFHSLGLFEGSELFLFQSLVSLEDGRYLFTSCDFKNLFNLLGVHLQILLHEVLKLFCLQGWELVVGKALNLSLE